MNYQPLPTRAAIDVGSNTIHLVVARSQPETLEVLVDEVEMVRIGESVTATGEISAQKILASLSTLKQYLALAQEHQAQPILVVATEAIRKAVNRQEFIDTIREETGLEVHLIAGETEATLTFMGATYESSDPNVGVMDLGGGSLELVTARNKQISWKTSVPIGSGWLHDRYLPDDLPAAEDISTAQVFLDTYFEGMPIKQVPSTLIATGGSASSLLYLARAAFRLPEDHMSLSLTDLMRCDGLLSALSAEEIAQRYQQPVARARILLAGSLIIQALMRRLKLERIQVTPHGIREGALLAYERLGDSWLEIASPTRHSGSESREESFRESGRRLLEARLDKYLEWRDEVIKEQDDIEPVHKMRVASRRLRATLDSFAPACEHKPFKKLYRVVQEGADVLGKARDADVMLRDLSIQLEQAPFEEQAALRWLIARLSTFRKQCQEDLRTHIEDLNERELRRLLVACLSREEV